MREETLDLTGLNQHTFLGAIRLRHISDWAHDYYKKHYKLSRIKLRNEQYRELMEEIYKDNRLLKAKPTEVFSVDLGFGEIEIINVDDDKRSLSYA